MVETMKQREAEIALQYAITNGRIDEVKSLLAEGVDPNCFGEKSGNFKYAFTALCEAVAAAGREIATSTADFRAAVRELADLPPPTQEEADRDRKTALEIIRILIAAGADPNMTTYSRTPVSLAACNKDFEVVKLLLDAGASPSGECWSPFSKLPKPKGKLAFFWNAIHEAAHKGSADIVKLLVERGADPGALDHEGKTALQIARERGHPDAVNYLETVTP